MSSVLVGMFETQDAAHRAKRQLVDAGFAESAIEMTGGTTSSTSMTSGSSSSGATSSGEPQGPIGRFFSNLFGDDDADNDGYADTYKEAFNRGSCGLTVTTMNDTEMDKAESILNAAGAIDIDEKAESWRKEGWTGGAMGAMAGAKGTASTLEAGATRKLQEVEEELKVGKRAVAKGGVRIYSRMTEVPVSETVRLREEHADIKRTAVDRPATEADLNAFEEGSIEVREMAEEAVVSKTARVTGEVEIGKTATEREETIRETVRKTTVDVEQIEGGTMTGSTRAAYSDSTGSANRDPISGELGSHPVGTAVGATAGAVATGAAVGSVAGPVGTAVGAAVGAVAGGLAGKGVAETVDPTTGKPKSKI